MDYDNGAMRTGLVTVHQGRFYVRHEATLDELFPQRHEKFAGPIFFATTEGPGVDAN
jgi:hypothetical protein